MYDNSHNDTDIIKDKVQNDPCMYPQLTTMTSTKIYTQGLLKTLNRYKENCVNTLKDQIECTIGDVQSMNPSDSKVKLFTFAYSEGLKLEYIGLAVRKFTDDGATGREMCNYTIYKYSYEEQSQVGLVTPTGSSWMWQFTDSLFINSLSYYSGQTQTKTMKKISLEDRISALKVRFMAELAKRDIVELTSDGNWKLLKTNL